MMLPMVVAVFEMHFHCFVLALGLKANMNYSYCNLHAAALVSLLIVDLYIDGARVRIDIFSFFRRSLRTKKTFMCRKIAFTRHFLILFPAQ